jgi:hypothetical protein
MSKIEEAMDAVLDTLIEADGVWTAPWGQVLSTLASAIHDEDVPTSGTLYQQTSAAVLRLETIELVVVDRAYHNDPAKANVVTRIRLA